MAASLVVERVTPAGYAFGGFRLDLRAHRLFEGDRPVELSARMVDLLLYLVERAGELVTKEQLLDALWPGVFVTENTLTRAVSDLRHGLGDDPREAAFIQTVARRGYRFVAVVTALSTSPDTATATLDDLRQFVTSLPLLETFDLDALDDARARLESAVAHLDDYAPLHVALANAWALTFEATRATATPAHDVLRRAEEHARRACTLAPAMGEAWATLAFVVTIGGGDVAEARAAARHAVQLEPGSWRHHFRLAMATWGDERLRAVQRTLALLPGFPFSCFLGAMVHVARRAVEAALTLVQEGAAAQEADATAPQVLPATGLHWLHGAVLAARGDTDAAIEALDREVASHRAGRLYSTEFAVTAWHWRAAVLARDRRHDEAMAALDAALALQPGHPRSLVARAHLLGHAGEAASRAAWASAAHAITALHATRRSHEAVACSAMRAVFTGQHDTALGILEGLLAQAPPGHAGWWIPIDPWLSPLHGSAGFGRVLRRLGQRAL